MARLKADGWHEVAVVGSRHQFKHPTKKGRTTVRHPVEDVHVKSGAKRPVIRIRLSTFERWFEEEEAIV